MSGFAHSSKKSFELPVSSKLLYLVSDGPESTGTVNLKSVGAVKDTVTVDVVIYYNTEQALDKADVHEIQDPAYGVGIYTPKDWHPHTKKDGLSFAVTVSFPASASTSPLVINKFETTLPVFSHEIDDLVESVYFRNLNLTTSESNVSSKSVFAETAVIQTSEGSITGSYSTNTSLQLITSEGEITTSVRLTNADESQPTELLQKTSTKKIDSDISLYSIPSDGDGGAFNVTARTSEDKLDIRFPVAPLNHILQFDATTSEKPVSAQIHPTYEGSFEAKTSESTVSVTYDQATKDPSGQGRQRHVDTTAKNKHDVKGNVYWGTQKDRGSVSVKTSEQEASIYLN